MITHYATAPCKTSLSVKKTNNIFHFSQQCMLTCHIFLSCVLLFQAKIEINLSITDITPTMHSSYCCVLPTPLLSLVSYFIFTPPSAFPSPTTFYYSTKSTNKNRWNLCIFLPLLHVPLPAGWGAREEHTQMLMQHYVSRFIYTTNLTQLATFSFITVKTWHVLSV